MNELDFGERVDGPTVMEKMAYQRYIRGEKITNVAERIGVARSTLCKYELGEHSAPFFVIEALCNLFGFKLTITDKKGRVIYENYYR